MLGASALNRLASWYQRQTCCWYSTRPGNRPKAQFRGAIGNTTFIACAW
jgi:hypothetical protein